MRFTSPAVRQFFGAGVAAFLSLGIARADVAVLRPIGPKTGSGFSTPGRIYDEAQSVPVAMRSARVAIRLKRIEGDRLQATCEAEFELLHLQAKGEPIEFLVGFPITGQARARSVPGALEIGAFHVSVDGKAPPLVRREFLWDGDPPKFRDDALQGALGGRFGPPVVRFDGGLVARSVVYPGHRAWHPGPKNLYGDRDGLMVFSDQDFLWTQKIAAGAGQKVVVAYTLVLRSQRLAYPEMGYDRNWTVEPEQVATLNKSRRYFFFDYVLRSGATWEGPIGRETITISAEPGVNLDQIVSFGRTPRREGAAWVWEIVNEDPTEDVLIALPL